MAETNTDHLHERLDNAVNLFSEQVAKFAGYVERLVVLEERNRSTDDKVMELKAAVAAMVAEIKMGVDKQVDEMKKRQDRTEEKVEDLSRTVNRNSTIIGAAAAGFGLLGSWLLSLIGFAPRT